VARLRKKQKPRRSGAPLPLLVPCFLARTRPLLCPRRSIRRPERRTSEPVARVTRAGAAGSTAGLQPEKEGNQRLRHLTQYRVRCPKTPVNNGRLP